MAHRTLRDAQLFGGPREALVAGCGFEGLCAFSGGKRGRMTNLPEGLHEKNWGWPEKRCFADFALPALCRRPRHEIMGVGGNKCQYLLPIAVFRREFDTAQRLRIINKIHGRR